MAKTLAQRIKEFAESGSRPSGVAEGGPRATASDGSKLIPSGLRRVLLPGDYTAFASSTGKTVDAPVYNEANPRVQAALQRSNERTAQVVQTEQRAEAERRRPRGRAATLLTGGQGWMQSPATSRRSLMGF